MSTDEYVPSEEQVEFAYIEFESEPSSHFADDNLLTRAEAQARWSRWLACVRRDAVEEYKNRQVKIHISPAPVQMVPVRAHCPRCGH